MKDRGERAKSGDEESGRGKRPLSRPTLSDLGVTKDQSSRWQQLAKLPEQKFEIQVGRATNTAVAAMDTPSGKRRPKPAPKPKPEVAGVIETCVRSVKSALHAALSALGSTRKERLDLFNQVETAIRQIRAEAAGADDLDQTGFAPNAERWSEQ
jgi:hypothetical protein